jgi:hypothetical protein
MVLRDLLYKQVYRVRFSAGAPYIDSEVVKRATLKMLSLTSSGVRIPLDVEKFLIILIRKRDASKK